jgi:hypothetical protein
LCRLWKERRAQHKIDALESKLEAFSRRLARLPSREKRTVRKALLKLAQIASLTTRQFEELGSAILTSWETGRLKELIDDLAQAEDLTADDLIRLLVEADVLTALNRYYLLDTR